MDESPSVVGAGPDAAGAMWCPLCQASGRWWANPEEAVYCGMCAARLRDVSVQTPWGEVVEPAAAEPLVWLVSGQGDSDGEGDLRLSVAGSGRLPARVDAVRVAGEQGVTAWMELGPLGVGEQRELRLSWRDAEPLRGVTRIEVVIEGALPTHRISVVACCEPESIEARTPPEDTWLLSAVDPADVPASGEATAVFPWWSNNEAELCLTVTWPGVAGSIVLPLRLAADAGRWEPFQGPAGSATQATRVRIDTAELSDTPARITLKLPEGSRPHRVIGGHLVLRLADAARRELRLPLRLIRGRPEWRLEAEAERVALPGGMISRLELTAEPGSGAGQGEATLSTPEGSVQPCLRLPVHQSPLTARVEPDLADRGVFGLTLQPNPAPAGQRYGTTLELFMGVEASAISGNPLEPVACRLSPTQRVRLDVFDPASAAVRGGAPREGVVDFGTTNSCAVLLAGQPPQGCLAFPDRGQPSDTVPTLLWLADSGERADPYAEIGQLAAFAARFRQSVPIRGFKPQLGRGSEDPADPDGWGPHYTDWPDRPGAEPPHYTAEEVTAVFLRELLLQMRRQHTQQAPLDRFWVCCPTAFSHRQRAALNRVLQRLKPYGVLGEVGIVVDEANAAALTDVEARLKKAASEGVTGSSPASVSVSAPAHLDVMVFDLGGGTTDIALIQARQQHDATGESGTLSYELIPCGVTGLPDFGGQNVTQAIAELLGEKLRAPLAAASEHAGARGGAWQVPLPDEHASERGPAVIEAVRADNARFLSEFAELVKTRAYGAVEPPAELVPAWSQPPGGPNSSDVGEAAGGDWYPRYAAARQELLQDELLNVALSRRLTAVHHGPSGPHPRPLPRGEGEREDEPLTWEGLYQQLSLTRDEVDDRIRPGMLELLGRAQRLWAHHLGVSDGAAPPPPDAVVLAGGSAHLTLLWTLLADAQTGLGYPAAELIFEPREAKRKLALGAARHAYQREMPGRVRLTPRHPLDYVLLPLGYLTAGEGFQCLFSPGGPAIPQIEPIRREYPGGETTLLLRLSESFDYRRDYWRPPPELQALGITAPGKGLLAERRLRLPEQGPRRVTYRLERQGPRRRVLVLEHVRPDGQPTTPPETVPV